MKKSIAILLVLCLCVGLCACGAETISGTINDAISQADEKNVLSFSETTVVDNDECSIKITKIEPDNMWGFTLVALLENKSAEKTYMFSVETATVNGVVCDPFFAAEVSAGKKANEKISFAETDEFKENGVGDFTDIQLTFRVYDSNDWMADPVAYETVHIYPYGEDKAVRFVRSAQDADVVLVDNEYVTVIATGYENDEIWGYTVNLYLVNKSDKNVMFSVTDASVNGFMADPFWATSAPADSCAFSSMSWSDETFEENGISAVEEIEFTLRVYDADNWTGDYMADESVTLKP